MKNIVAARTAKIERTSIEYFSIVGSELTDEHLQLVSGGAINIGPVRCYTAASCTMNNDEDYQQVDGEPENPFEDFP